MLYIIRIKTVSMNSVVLDCATAAISIVIFILSLLILPAFLPAGLATLAAIILFIIVMSGGGYYISKNPI